MAGWPRVKWQLIGGDGKKDMLSPIPIKGMNANGIGMRWRAKGDFTAVSPEGEIVSGHHGVVAAAEAGVAIPESAVLE